MDDPKQWHRHWHWFSDHQIQYVEPLRHASTWTAKASLISMMSISFICSPALSNALGMPSLCQYPWFWFHSYHSTGNYACHRWQMVLSRALSFPINKLLPSFNPEAFPAVTVPFDLNAGFKVPNFRQLSKVW